MVKLSIIIANYNYGHFLEEAILSIVGQKGSYEIIIVDDASTDHSRELIGELAKKWPSIRYHFHRANQGTEESFNTGFRLAQGEYIHPFASDDLYLPGSIKTLFTLFDTYPHIPLFCLNCAFFTHPDTIQINKVLPHTYFCTFSPQQALQLFRSTNFFIPGHTAFIKREVYTKYMPQDKLLDSLSDWVINHQIALDEGFGYLPENLIAMRIHAKSKTAQLTLATRKRAWQRLLYLLEESDKLKRLSQAGILRMLGLKAIYKEILTTPRYWKHIPPMLFREVRKKFFSKSIHLSQ